MKPLFSNDSSNQSDDWSMPWLLLVRNWVKAIGDLKWREKLINFYAFSGHKLGRNRNFKAIAFIQVANAFIIVQFNNELDVVFGMVPVKYIATFFVVITITAIASTGENKQAGIALSGELLKCIP